MGKINLTQSGRGYLLRVSASEICNYDCAFCHPIRDGRITRLTDEEFLQIFRMTNDLYVLKTLHFTGGEPLTRDSLPEIIKECRKLSGSALDIAMTTNASLLGQKLSALAEANLPLTFYLQTFIIGNNQWINCQPIDFTVFLIILYKIHHRSW